MTRRLKTLGMVLTVAALAAGCAAGKAFRQGDDAMRAGDLDQAVAYYRTAVQSDPDNTNYKIGLERAMLAASRAHFERGREFEADEQLEAARGEYQMAAELDPSNRTAAGKVAGLDQTIRDRNEAARPRPAIETLRAQARAASAAPMLNPATDVVNLRFTNTNLRDILDTIGITTGINVSYDRDVAERLLSVQLDGVTVEEALNQLMLVGQLSYKVFNEQSILVFPDTPQKHTQYDDQVIQTFYVSHADATELVQVLSALIRLPGLAIQPALQANATANTIVVRGTRSMVEIIERVIRQNDKPRAEIVFDIEILEVNRARVKAFGLNLSQYSVGGIFSPEVAPGGGGDDSPGGSTPPTSLQSPPPFNLNTITRGVNTADFYLAVPTALVRFLESDTQTKLIAKPQLRGAEGTQLTLNLGDEVPVVTTSYTPIATGGAGVNPLNSFQLKPVGINIDITPRVTVEGDVLITLNLESSSRGADVNIAGTNYPSFGSRRVSTQLRLRDGEPNLLAGLLREDERQQLSGFPGAIHVPILRELFSNNDKEVAQTDIVMLMTPHIVRTHGITEEDLRPIYIGSQQNLGLGGPPPLIAPPEEPEPVAPPAAAAVPRASAPRPPAAAAGTATSPQLTVPGGATLEPPPGATPVPGAVLVPPAPPAAAPPPPPAAPPPPEAGAGPSGPPLTTPGLGLAQIIISLPGEPFRVSGGPYTVPLSVTNASRLSTVTLTLSFDPALLRVRAVQEGSFMRSGAVNATFIQDVAPGRVDVTIARTDDATGATGTGLLAAVLLDAVEPGTATLTVSGAATGPGGAPMGLQFQPVTFTIRE